MSNSVQMKLIADAQTAGDAAGLGMSSEQDLAAAAWAVARRGALAELSEPEAALVGQLGPVRHGADPDGLVASIRAGGDPLGEALMRLRPPDRRRVLGATYTPPEIVSAMVGWAAGRVPGRVVDPGTGSARFLTAAGRALPKASLVGVEIDPLAALLARANLTAAGFDDRSRVVVHDYRTADLGEGTGATAYLGNPPYVRHHQIEPSDKVWLARRAADLGPTLARRPQLGRFITAFGAPSNPLDPPSAAAQAEVIKTTIETLRRLMYHPTGGFLLQALADIPPTNTSPGTTSTTSPASSPATSSADSPAASPAASSAAGSGESSKALPGGGMGVLDHRRQPKPAWDALVSACRDLIVVSDPLPDPIHPGDRLDLAVHAVSQLRHPIGDAVVKARLTPAERTAADRLTPAGGAVADQRWTGEIAPDACTFIGRITATAPTAPGSLTLELELTYEDNGQPVTATNHYQATISAEG